MADSSEKIKLSQYLFLVAGFIHGSHTLFGAIEKQTGHDYWIVLIAAFIVSIPLLLVFTALARKYPGKDLVQILEEVFGKAAGKAVSAVYFIFFLLLVSFNTRDIASFYVGFFMQETPVTVFILTTLLVCAFAVKKGMGSLAKISLLTVAFGVFVPILTSLLLVGEMDFSNFLPIMEKPAEEFISPLSNIILLPFGEAIALLAVTPLISDKKKLGRYTIGGMAVAVIMFFIVGIRNTAVLGGSAEAYGQLALQSIRMINIGEFLTRIEITVALVLTTASFVKIGVLYYAAVTSVSSMLSLKSKSSLIIPVGCIAFALSAVVFPSTAYHNEWLKIYAAAFGLLCSGILPVITLIVSLFRKKNTAASSSQSQNKA